MAIQEQRRAVQVLPDGTALRYYGQLLVTVIWWVFMGAVPVLAVFASLLIVAANFFLLRVSRRILYSLVTTYVAGPGAPEWVAAKRNIIALPIPRSVTTLSFQMQAEERQGLIASARRATLTQLTRRLSRAEGGRQHHLRLLTPMQGPTRSDPVLASSKALETASLDSN